MSAIRSVSGRALPLRGDDIDTDRIIPARFLVAVTFEGLGEHAFEDDRAALSGAHAFDRPEFAGAKILLVNRNFGCGSSREHAPQALQRRGIRAIVGESYSEIFAGNALVLGLPCVTASYEVVEKLQSLAESQPDIAFSLDLESETVTAGDLTASVALKRATRDALLAGTWDSTGALLARFEEVRAVATKLPYVRGFADPRP